MVRRMAFLALAFALGGGTGWPADTAAVKKLFDNKCASCHAKDGKGNTTMAKPLKLDASKLNLLTPATLGKTDAELAAVTSEGREKMPAYKGKIKPEDIAGLVTYIRSLAGAR